MTAIEATPEEPFPDLPVERARALVHRLVGERDDRQSLVVQIASLIGAEIVVESHAPGDELNSVELARRFDASRTPVREALMLLEKEGVVEIQARRRARVAVLSPGEVREIYLCRAALLELIAADIVRSATDEEIESLEPILERMRSTKETGDVETYLWHNIAFQTRNAEISHNRTVTKILDSLLLRTIRFRRLSLSQPARLERSYDDDFRLLQAYRDRDPTLAAALIRSGHMNALASLEGHFSRRAAA